MGGPPSLRPRPGHRGIARRHHPILRVARGPAPDTSQRHGGWPRPDRRPARRPPPGGAGGRRGGWPASLATALGLASLFSPALFYRPMLGLFSSSAGSLVVLGLVLLLAAALLWRRGIARRWWTVSAAAVLVLAAPYLVRYFGRGIAPPAGGVSLLEPIGLWISGQLAGAAARGAPGVFAAGLGRRTAGRRRVPA